jgi:hypothetical protein
MNQQNKKPEDDKKKLITQLIDIYRSESSPNKTVQDSSVPNQSFNPI